jgi:hypothetical protein
MRARLRFCEIAESRGTLKHVTKDETSLLRSGSSQILCTDYVTFMLITQCLDIYNFFDSFRCQDQR